MPKSSVLSVSETKDVFTATDARLSNAIVALELSSHEYCELVALSPVFVPLFVPVISLVKAIVPAASFKVYILSAVLVFTK